METIFLVKRDKTLVHDSVKVIWADRRGIISEVAVLNSLSSHVIVPRATAYRFRSHEKGQQTFKEDKQRNEHIAIGEDDGIYKRPTTETPEYDMKMGYIPHSLEANYATRASRIAV